MQYFDKDYFDMMNRFLKELTVLSNKHRVEIMGCGCCGSPSLRKVEFDHGKYESDENFLNLEFVESAEIDPINYTINPITEDHIFSFILNLGDPAAVLERLNTRYDNWVSANNECGAQRHA